MITKREPDGIVYSGMGYCRLHVSSRFLYENGDGPLVTLTQFNVIEDPREKMGLITETGGFSKIEVNAEDMLQLADMLKKEALNKLAQQAKLKGTQTSTQLVAATIEGDLKITGACRMASRLMEVVNNGHYVDQQVIDAKYEEVRNEILKEAGHVGE